MTSPLRKPMLVLATVLAGGLASTAAMAFPWSAAPQSQEIPTDSNPPGSPAPAASVELVANSRHYRDGSFTGPVSDAYYGLVQVQANIQGGRLVSIDVLQYPSDRRTSRAINSQALPALESEVVTAQTTRVNIVTGATLTSNAYLRSLGGALRQANS